MFEKGGPRAVQHVIGCTGDWPKAAALYQDRLFVEDVGRLNHLAIRGENNCVGQSLADELKAHQTVVYCGIGGAREFDQVDLHPIGRQVLLERCNLIFRVWWIKKRQKKEYDDRH